MEFMEFKRYAGVEVNGKCLIIDAVSDQVIKTIACSFNANKHLRTLNSSACGICNKKCDKART